MGKWDLTVEKWQIKGPYTSRVKNRTVKSKIRLYLLYINIIIYSQQNLLLEKQDVS